MINILHFNKELLFNDVDNNNNENIQFEYLTSNIDNQCYSCNGILKKSYTTTIFDQNTNKYLKLKTCGLCNIVANFKTNSLGKCFLVHTDMSQTEINLKTLDFFNKNDYLPYPNDISHSVKLINISPYDFINIYDLLTSHQRTLFSDFKFMFTNKCYNLLKVKSVNYFGKSNNDDSVIPNQFDNSYFNFDKYVLSSDQNNLLNDKLQQIRTIQNKKIKPITLSMNTKYLNAIQTHNSHLFYSKL